MKPADVFELLTFHPDEGGPETGYFKWKKRRGIVAGQWAGTVNQLGYRVLMLKGRLYREHRLIHLVVCGWVPELIDHIDGNKLNNCISNLRGASQSQNMMNMAKHKGASSQYRGVSRSKGKFWVATIHVNGANLALYHGDNEMDAAKAYNEAAKKHFGEFANLNTFHDGKLVKAEVLK